MIGFLLAAVITSIVPMSQSVPQGLGQFGKFLIVMAMATIGLSTNIMALVTQGRKPLILGLVCWVAVAVVSLAVQYFSGIL